MANLCVVVSGLAVDGHSVCSSVWTGCRWPICVLQCLDWLLIANLCVAVSGLAVDGQSVCCSVWTGCR